MTEYKIIIVEDDALIAYNISDMLNDAGFEVVATYHSYDEALNSIGKVTCDLYLVDINLNDTHTGIDLAEQIQATNPTPFIFLSAYSDAQTLQQALVHNPSAYLVKPANEQTLFTSIQVAIHNYNNKQTASLNEEAVNYIYIKVGRSDVKVYWNDVEVIEHEKNYVKLVSSAFQSSGYHVRSSLQNLVTTILPAQAQQDFVQISRATIVNKRIIEHMRGSNLYTSKGVFPIGESYTKSVKKVIDDMAL
jgi:two-component system, LytTR family, response regulator LytT